MQTIDTLKNISQTNLNRLQAWSQERHIPLQTVGLLALAGGAGMVIGVIAAKGVLATKGASALAAALAQNGATVQGATTILTGATTLPAKAVALVGLLTHNALPLTVGAGVGGATGVGVMQSQVRRATQQRDEQIAQTTAAQAQANRVQSALSHTEAQLSQLQGQLATATPAQPSTTPANDPLEAIHGIGPVYARRLRAAGIQTFAQLAQLTPEQLQAAIGPLRTGHKTEVAHWIAEARQLSERRAA